MTDSRRAEWIKRKRKEWVSTGKCRDCGTPTVPGETGKNGRIVTGYRCAECRDRANRWQAARKRRRSVESGQSPS